MTASTLSKESQACFQFKASFAPCTILQLSRYDLTALKEQLVEAISKAPNFFIGSPVLLDLEKIKTVETIHFSKLKQILIDSGLAPIGVRGGTEEQMIAAVTAGLPQVNLGKVNFNDTPAKKTEEKEPTVTINQNNTKLVSTPIRSGMQVYAKGGDLIVIGHVSPGAELLADGHIHVYGSLRGRALAGVLGNTNARIFCNTLEAELVSIAGFYLTKEDMLSLPKQDMIQIYLEEEQVKIKGI